MFLEYFWIGRRHQNLTQIKIDERKSGLEEGKKKVKVSVGKVNTWLQVSFLTWKKHQFPVWPQKNYSLAKAKLVKLYY